MGVFSDINQEAGLFLSLNNDINRIVHTLDSVPEIKKLLYYIDRDPLQQKDLDFSLVDKTIWRDTFNPFAQ